MKVGFIGLGNMGAPMAENLAKAGHAVTGFDLTAPCPDGVTKATTATDAATGQDVVITMLPNGAILRSVADQIIPAMNAGAVLLDCSTVDVESARAVAGGIINIDATSNTPTTFIARATTIASNTMKRVSVRRTLMPSTCARSA